MGAQLFPIHGKCFQTESQSPSTTAVLVWNLAVLYQRGSFTTFTAQITPLSLCLCPIPSQIPTQQRQAKFKDQSDDTSHMIPQTT